jgi:hypothetical protein
MAPITGLAAASHSVATNKLALTQSGARPIVSV